MHLIIFILLVLTTIVCSGPVNSTHSHNITENVHEQSTQSNNKCPYLRSSALFTPKPKYLDKCNNRTINSTSIEYEDVPQLICSLYNYTFNELCVASSNNIQKDVLNEFLSNNSLEKITPKNVSQICDVIGRFFNNTNEKSVIAQLFLNKNKCEKICTDVFATTVQDGCSKSAYMLNVTNQLQNKKNISKPKVTNSEIIDNIGLKKEVLTQKQQIVQKAKVTSKPSTTSSPTADGEQYYNQEEGSSQTSKVAEVIPTNIQDINSKTKNDEDTLQPSLPENKNNVVTGQNNKPTSAEKNVNEKTTQQALKTSPNEATLPEKSLEIDLPPPNEVPEETFSNKDDYKDDEEDGLHWDDKVVAESGVEKSKPKHVDADSTNLASNYPNQSINEDDSYFFSYFMMICIVFILGYVGYHNKQKILALVLEGRRGKRQQRRRPNSANYHKLDSNLEEAVTSSCNKNVTNVIY